MAMSIQKPKYILLRMALIAILVALFLWSYVLFSETYKRVVLSHKMVVALLDNKTELAHQYADQLGLVQSNLDRTESFLADIKQENAKLKEKVKLLDQLKDMEHEIGQLKEQNAQMQTQMLEESYQKKPEKTGFDFDTFDKGRSLLQKFKQKIRDVKDRISFLKKKEFDKKVAIQQEVDRKESLLGNNGYLVKEGKAMPVNMPDVKNLPDNAKINVKFVK